TGRARGRARASAGGPDRRQRRRGPARRRRCGYRHHRHRARRRARADPRSRLPRGAPCGRFPGRAHGTTGEAVAGGRPRRPGRRRRPRHRGGRDGRGALAGGVRTKAARYGRTGRRRRARHGHAVPGRTGRVSSSRRRYHRPDRRGAPPLADARKGHPDMRHSGMRHPGMRTIVRAILVAAAFALATAQAQVAITYWQYDFATRIDAMNQLIEQFNAENPDVVVTQETFPYDAYQQRVAASLAAGEGPDVVQLFYGWVGPWQRAGYIEPLPKEHFADEWIQDYFIPMVESVNIGGDYYGLPTAVRALALFYNKDQFREVGLDPDSPPTTWDEFIEAAKMLTTQRGPRFERIGFGIAPNGQDHHLVRTVLMNQLGTPPYSDDNTEVLYGNEIGAEALAFYTSWQTEH